MLDLKHTQKDMTQLAVLASDKVKAIHQATLRILEEVGIVLTQSEAREILTGVGAKVRGNRVLLPPDLVERTIALCPRKVITRGRDTEPVVLGDGSLHWHNLGGAPDVYEPRTGERRAATVQDVRDSARLLDALDSVTTVTPFFTPQDVPGSLMSLAMYRHTLPHTIKPVQGVGCKNLIQSKPTRKSAILARFHLPFLVQW